MTSSTTASQEELKANKVPLGYRDQCSACVSSPTSFRYSSSWHDGCVRVGRLLIGLNQCRRKNSYVPWECEDERHGYEKCVFRFFFSSVQEDG